MIKPVSFVKKLSGHSQSSLITFDDGNDYVVKHYLPGLEKTLPNEWVAYCLARYLELPIPFAQIVEIPLEFTEQIPDVVTSNSKYQFASRYTPGCLDGHKVFKIKKIVNNKKLAAIILFDYWLSNSDRTRKNILLREESNKNYYLSIIDHANCFGSDKWMEEDIVNLPVEIIKSATHRIMASFIDSESEFYEALKVIQTIPLYLIEEIVSLIPDDWQVTETERNMLMQCLVNRRDILPSIVEKYIDREYIPLHQRKGKRKGGRK